MRRFSTLLLALATLALVACNAGAAVTPTATPTASPTPTTPGSTATPTPTATPDGPRGDLGEVLASLDPSAGATEPDRDGVLPAVPPSAFPQHDRESTVLYDTHTGEAFDFGPGEWGWFSPDGRYMVWAAGSPATELRVIDLDTREQRSLGPARWVREFVDARTVDVFLPGTSNEREIVNIETGERGPAPGLPDDVQPEVRGDYELASSLVRTGDDPWPPARYTLRDLHSGEVLAEFDATSATFAGPDALVVATPWTGESVNLYLVDLQSADATFVATVRLDQIPVMPLAATPELIAWTENYCNYPEPQGQTWYYDRANGELVRLDRALWVGLTPDGRLTDGWGFGALALIDRDPLRYDVVLSEGSVDVNWSPDYRYASRGVQWGHGGVCPP